jgi:dCMP deaminase
MDWDTYFMGHAQHCADKSKDRSSKFGCVVVGPDNEIRTTGYNGFPRGVNDDDNSRHERPEKYFWAEHAERNAIYNAARVGIPLKGCRIYVNGTPCMDCARAIVQAGIVEVIKREPSGDYQSRWGEHTARINALFNESSVTMRDI